MNNSNFVIKEILGEGVLVTVKDENISDEFDDYLTEERYVLYDMKIKEGSVDFCFGEASCSEKIKIIISNFLAKNGNRSEVPRCQQVKK